MRIIKIISDGVPIEVEVDDDKSLEEAAKYLNKLVDSDKIVTLIGKNSAAIMRPSSISGIGIRDTIDEAPEKHNKVIINKEQKNERVDIISDR